LDFAKAFDKVPHARLMHKVRAHGIRGLVGNWIENWLSGRQQKVCEKGSGSAWAYVTSGVPQGSVLGPILFLIFINDLDSEIINWILKFADDSKLFGEDQSESDHQCLQQDLQKLFDWSVKWQMEFNLDKCKVMHFGRNNQHYKYSMNSMNSRQLGVVDI